MREDGDTQHYAANQRWVCLKWKGEGGETFLDTENSEHWLGGTAFPVTTEPAGNRHGWAQGKQRAPRSH